LLRPSDHEGKGDVERTLFQREEAFDRTPLRRVHCQAIDGVRRDGDHHALAQCLDGRLSFGTVGLA
jgi:hypothetical protein